MSGYRVISFQGFSLPKEYRGLVFSKWLRSLRFGNDYFKLIEADAYYKTYDRFIANLLSKPETVVSLAVLSDDPDVVLGFAVYRGKVLDYIYVHKDQRRLGIAKVLLPKELVAFTHVTKTALTIWGSKYSHLKFNPFA